MGALESQDAIMEGTGRYIKWRKNFVSEFQETTQKGQLKQAWAMMPPEMKEWLKKNDPKGYKQVLSLLEGR